MTTRIGLISDVHASPAPLREALQIFQREQVDDIFCLGDIAGYFDGLQPCIELLQQYHCKTIIGNHDESFVQSPLGCDSASAEYLAALPRFLQLEIEGQCIYLVHAQPPDGTHGGIKLLDQHGGIIDERKQEWTNKLRGFPCDVLIVGHTHQVFAELLGDLLVLNPGSAPFNHSCMILDLPDGSVQIHALEQKSVVRSWNFGRLFHGDDPYPVL